MDSADHLYVRSAAAAWLAGQGATPAHVRQPVRIRVMCEMTGPVRVQLRGQLAAAAAEQNPAPEGVVRVDTAEYIQLDRFHRQHQRLIRVRPAEHRRLNPSPVRTHKLPHPLPQHILSPAEYTN
ncbi:hypothetical protein [Streptomyces rimosus]|uniref:hypothetical protein n=1 Tax=Streptomyces rimosus TaxID=1927 RepID=UPI000A61D4A3|nr:hypothetical protein [Streptomyces rimosus]